MSQTSFDWDRLRIFYIVAEAGSFTEAGKKLHLSQSAVSRQIAALEDSLGIPLFHRHARGLVMTEAGESLFETARELSTRLLNVEDSLRSQHAAPHGRLRVFATVGLGSVWLAPRLKKFMDQFPEIELVLNIDNYGGDLTKAEADCGLQNKPPNQPGIIQKVFAEYTVGLYASEKYLSAHGFPKTPKDLDQHQLIVFNEAGQTPPYHDVNWLLTYGRDENSSRKPSITANNIYAMMSIAAHGAGIVSLPDYMPLEEKRLIRLFDDQPSQKLKAYFVYPEALRKNKRIEAFRDFLIDEAANTAFVRK